MPHHMETSHAIEENLNEIEGQIKHKDVDAYVDQIGKNIKEVNQKVRMSYLCNYIFMKMYIEDMLYMSPW